MARCKQTARMTPSQRWVLQDGALVCMSDAMVQKIFDPTLASLKETFQATMCAMGHRLSYPRNMHRAMVRDGASLDDVADGKMTALARKFHKLLMDDDALRAHYLEIVRRERELYLEKARRQEERAKRAKRVD